MSRKRPRSPSPSGRERDGTDGVFMSNPIEDRGSTHIGLYAPPSTSMTAKELQAQPNVKEASHRIAAWRTRGKQTTISGKPIYDVGHDDDGEQHAGKKLERLLVDMNVEGAVVVARWYGGVLLGPVRFTHFENCARGAIERWRAHVAEEAKRRKVEVEEGLERGKLVEVLARRDESIAVLREMLAEKMAAKKREKTKDDGRGTGGGGGGGGGEEENEAVSSSQLPQSQVTPKKLDYSSMDLSTLRRLEKARDGTLAWILKQIDKAEETQLSEETSAMPEASTKGGQIDPATGKEANTDSSNGKENSSSSSTGSIRKI